MFHFIQPGSDARGGPGVSTLEVAIYTSVRFDFDLPKAAVLSALQLIIAGFYPVAVQRRCPAGPTGYLWPARPCAQMHSLFLANWQTVLFWAVLPDCALPAYGLFFSARLAEGVSLFDRPFWQAFWSSTSLGSARLSYQQHWPYLMCRPVQDVCRAFGARLGRAVINLSQSVYRVLPAIVLGTASFLVFRPVVNLFDHVFCGSAQQQPVGAAFCGPPD